MHIKRVRTIAAVSVGLAIALGGYLVYRRHVLRATASRQAHEERARRARAWDGLKYEVLEQINSFSGDTALVIKDLDMNWQMTYHKDRRMPAASLAKIPVLISCLYACKNGLIEMEKTVVLKNSFKTGGAGSLKTVAPGAVLSIGELMRLMICESDNTAANMLIDLVGEDFVNRCTRKFGLGGTVLERKMMDFTARKQGIENYTSAADMAHALEMIYGKKLIDEESSSFALGLLREQKYNDRIPAALPDDALVAHKTGLERSVCHDVGIVFTPKGDFLICVLTNKEKASSISKAFISRIAQLVYSYYQEL